jgi:hypothetical protein
LDGVGAQQDQKEDGNRRFDGRQRKFQIEDGDNPSASSNPMFTITRTIIKTTFVMMK